MPGPFRRLLTCAAHLPFTASGERPQHFAPAFRCSRAEDGCPKTARIVRLCAFSCIQPAVFAAGSQQSRDKHQIVTDRVSLLILNSTLRY